MRSERSWVTGSLMVLMLVAQARGARADEARHGPTRAGAAEAEASPVLEDRRAKRQMLGLGLVVPGALLTVGGVALVATTAGGGGGGGSNASAGAFASVDGPDFSRMAPAGGALLLMAGVGLSVAGGAVLASVDDVPELTYSQRRALEESARADAEAARAATAAKARADERDGTAATEQRWAAGIVGVTGLAAGGGAVAIAATGDDREAAFGAVALGVVGAGALTTSVVLFATAGSDATEPEAPGAAPVRASLVLNPAWVGLEGSF